MGMLHPARRGVMPHPDSSRETFKAAAAAAAAAATITTINAAAAAVDIA